MSLDSPALTARQSTRQRQTRLWFLLISLAVTFALVDGSRCTPADLSKPVVTVGDVPLVASPSTVLRVGTFNIHSGRGRDRQFNLARTAAVFSAPLDVIGLNEVRGAWDQSLGSDQAAQLGQLLGMRSIFLPTERRWWHDHFGNGLLTRIPLMQVQRIPLVCTRGKAYRCATLAQFELHTQTVQLLSVHVDSQSDREHQLRTIISLFMGLQAPAVLIGDLNSPPDDPQMIELLNRPDVVNPLKDALPDKRGRQHIDWILARGFQSRSGQLIENDASDHPAAVAELELVKPSAE